MMLRVAVSNSYLFHSHMLLCAQTSLLGAKFLGNNSDTDDDAAETSGCTTPRPTIRE